MEGYVRSRMERQKILEETGGPQLWEIVHEAALRVPVGGPEVMRGQLARLHQMVTARQVVVQVHPFASGPHTFMMGVVSLMTFTDSPPVAYMEGPHTGQLVEEPALVERCRASYDLARAAALPPEASLAVIGSVAEDFANS